MSKLGKKPILIPDGVILDIKDDFLSVKGKAGSLSLFILPGLQIAAQDGQIKIFPKSSDRQAKINWGTMSALLRNAIRGIQEPFTKTLELEGIGFKVSLEGKALVLNIGFTHPVKFVPPEGVTIAVEKNQIKISGIDKAKVGLTAAQIRAIKKPEPYKGKGIHYLGEVIRRKAAKKAASGVAVSPP